MTIDSEIEELILSNGELKFTALSYGLKEKSDKPLILFLHGFPDSSRTFCSQLSALHQAGYRVLAPTLRGYETSSQPSNKDYSLVSLCGDVIAWLDDLGEETVHILGHDWGAAIAATVAAKHPERFISLTLLGCPNIGRITSAVWKAPHQIITSWYMTFFQLRGVADYFVERNEWQLCKKLWTLWSPDYNLPEAEWEHLCDMFKIPGVKKAMLSYYRQNLSPRVFLGMKDIGAVALVPVKTLIVYGINDGCFDTRVFETICLEEDFPDGLEMKPMDGVGHFPHLERADETNHLLINWFSRFDTQREY